METWKVISLDVWGHEPGGPDCSCSSAYRCEGWTINQAFHTGRTVEAPSDATDDQIVEALIDAGELSWLARGNVKIDDSGEAEFLYLEGSDDGRPLLHLERV